MRCRLPSKACSGLFRDGRHLTSAPDRAFALACLCFIMGMQNATITKISGARIRTTYATGMVTDIGIELERELFGRIYPWRRLKADHRKLRIYLRLVGTFVAGGVLGAIGFSRFGFIFALLLPAVLLALSVPSLLRRRGRTRTRPQ